MGSFLLRFWLNPAGTLSRRHFRIFLGIYFAILLPTFTAILMAFLILGYRRESGILHTETTVKFWILATIYTIMSGWPLVVASIKRMNDLKLRGPFRFFYFNPVRTFQNFSRMLNERGPSAEED